MSVTELELSQSELELFAIAAANIAGGRHQFRANSDVKAASDGIVAKVRKAKRNAAKRESYKWRLVGTRFAYDCGYSSDDNARIVEWQNAIAELRPVETRVRAIARTLLKGDNDAIAELGEWRAIVRKYIAVRNRDNGLSLAERLGAFPVSLADMRADNGSRFFNYATKKWNVAGYPRDMFGADVSDAFQTAMADAIESGDWINGRIPIYGALWRHMAITVRRAIWQNTRFTYDAPEAAFDWAEWETTANADIAAFRLRTETDNRQTIAEWVAYDEWRAIRDAAKATRERIESERAERLAMLTESRRAIATLLNGGMTFRRIASVLGRNPESLASDLRNEPLALAPRILPARKATEAETAERVANETAVAEHAAMLRRRHARTVFYQGGSVTTVRNVSPVPQSPVTIGKGSGTYVPFVPTAIVGGCTCIRNGCQRHV